MEVAVAVIRERESVHRNTDPNKGKRDTETDT